MSIGAELKEDKIRHIEEIKELRQKLGDAINENRVLAVANARHEEKAIRFQEKVSRLEKETKVLKAVKVYREYGILTLTVFLGLPSLFTLTGWLRFVVGCVVLCVLSFICTSLFHNRNNE